MTIQELELEVIDLKNRVERLEARLRQLTDDEQSASPPAPGDLEDREKLLAWLKAQGLVREPTEEERRIAAEWDALPEEEKEAVRWEMDHLPPGPMVSDIISENRR